VKVKLELHDDQIFVDADEEVSSILQQYIHRCQYRLYLVTAAMAEYVGWALDVTRGLACS